MASPRKGLRLDNFYYSHLSFPINESRWTKLRGHIPSDHLTSASEIRLRSEIEKCCSWLITEQRRLEERAKSAKVVLKGRTKDPAPALRLIKMLRQAANTWSDVKGFHDDLLGKIDLRRFDELETMADDLESRLERLRSKNQNPIKESPWDEFVRKVASCLRKEKLNPTAGGGVYNATAKLSWFQEFMIALNKCVLGKNGRASNEKALAASIAKAMSGYQI